MDKIAGIYEIRNTVNDKFYLGSSINIQKRCAQHRSNLRSQRHDNIHLQRAWNKHGEDSFEFRVLFDCLPEFLLTFEQMAMNTLKPEYNIETSAYKPPSWNGKQHSEETKRKMSSSQVGHSVSMETRRKIGVAAGGHKRRLGAIVSAETRLKLSKANRGKKHSMETKIKMSRHHMGIHHSEETKRKMSEIKKKWWSSRIELENG